MTRERWRQLRQFILINWFWKPIWKGSLILGPRNKLAQRLFSIADGHCLLKPSEMNTLLGYPIVEVDGLPEPALVFGDFRAYMEYKIRPYKGKEST